MWTKGSSKLTSSERQELIYSLCQVFCSLKTAEEVAKALTDLLTPKEIETIAKRLKIAELLTKGYEYEAIRKELKVGFSTVSRVNTWLNLAGEGFKILLERKKEPLKVVDEQERYDPYSWYNVKRRYTLSFWPQLLLEELLKAGDENERKKIARVLEKLDLKVSSLRSSENKAVSGLFKKEVVK